MWADYVAMFFLSCVLVAGSYGALTVSKKNLLCTGFTSADCFDFGALEIENN